MAGAYLVQLDRSKGGGTFKDGVDSLVVWAEGTTDAKLIAKAQQIGTAASDAAWDAATVTALAATADFEGWRLRVTVTGLPTADIDLTVVGTSSDDMDAVAALMVTALNATADIAGAAYSSGTLTISETTDGNGDDTVTVEIFAPLSNSDFPDPSFSFTNLIGTITHEGSSGAALSVVLDNTAPVPTLIARLKS
jgi:hypothetical protein